MLLGHIFYFFFIMETIPCLGLQRKFKSKLDLLKKKMNDLIKGQKGFHAKPFTYFCSKSFEARFEMTEFFSQGNELFLDIADLEYPRTNATLRRAYRKRWNEYYECLKNQLKDAGVAKTTYPIALFALEGTSIKLKCKLCLSPAELLASESIEWMHRSSSSNVMKNVPIEISDHVLVTPDNKDLHLYHVKQSDAGVYQCQLEDTASVPYFVHVASGKTEKTRLVRPETFNSPKDNPTPSEKLDEYGLKVFSLWSPWSPCSTCGKVGQRIRYGYCTISLINSEEQINESYERESGENEIKKNNEKGETDSEIEKRNAKRSGRLHHSFKRDMADTKMTTEITTNGFEATTTLGGTDEMEEEEDQKSSEGIKILAESILPVFRNRLPCRSPQTPKDIQKIKQIRLRKTEIMKGLCKIKCKKEVIFEVRDKSGNIIESANNSAGVFSMLQGLPEPRPTVERTTIYRRHGKSTELVCPGNLNEDIPVVWQIGTKVLVPLEIEKTTKGRITIDPQQRILIKKLRFADANIYSCWQRGELAGTIRLQVTTEVELKVDHRIFMIGAIIIVTVMLRIFWRAFRGRKRFTIH